MLKCRLFSPWYYLCFRRSSLRTRQFFFFSLGSCSRRQRQTDVYCPLPLWLSSISLLPADTAVEKVQFVKKHSSVVHTSQHSSWLRLCEMKGQHTENVSLSCPFISQRVRSSVVIRHQTVITMRCLITNCIRGFSWVVSLCSSQLWVFNGPRRIRLSGMREEMNDQWHEEVLVSTHRLSTRVWPPVLFPSKRDGLHPLGVWWRSRDVSRNWMCHVTSLRVPSFVTVVPLEKLRLLVTKYGSRWESSDPDDLKSWTVNQYRWLVYGVSVMVWHCYLCVSTPLENCNTCCFLSLW